MRVGHSLIKVRLHVLRVFDRGLHLSRQGFQLLAVRAQLRRAHARRVGAQVFADSLVETRPDDVRRVRRRRYFDRAADVQRASIRFDVDVRHGCQEVDRRHPLGVTLEQLVQRLRVDVQCLNRAVFGETVDRLAVFSRDFLSQPTFFGRPTERVEKSPVLLYAPAFAQVAPANAHHFEWAGRDLREHLDQNLNHVDVLPRRQRRQRFAAAAHNPLRNRLKYHLARRIADHSPARYAARRRVHQADHRAVRERTVAHLASEYRVAHNLRTLHRVRHVIPGVADQLVEGHRLACRSRHQPHRGRARARPACCQRHRRTYDQSRRALDDDIRQPFREHTRLVRDERAQRRHLLAHAFKLADVRQHLLSVRYRGGTPVRLRNALAVCRRFLQRAVKFFDQCFLILVEPVIVYDIEARRQIAAQRLRVCLGYGQTDVRVRVVEVYLAFDIFHDRPKRSVGVRAHRLQMFEIILGANYAKAVPRPCHYLICAAVG